MTVIRASVPKLELDSSFEQKNDIAKAVEQELEKVIFIHTNCVLSETVQQFQQLIVFLAFVQAMSAYGYEIVQTLIVDIEPDVNVKRAMNEINAGNAYNLIF